jgi:hypothetical protein
VRRATHRAVLNSQDANPTGVQLVPQVSNHHFDNEHVIEEGTVMGVGDRLVFWPSGILVRD